MNVAILLFPGAEELDVLAPYEVFQAARGLGAPFTTRLESLGEPGPIRLAHGAVLLVAETFTQADLLVVPGGGWANHAETGARAEAARPETLARLRHAHASGTLVAGVCTGTMLLARAGLLRDRPAVTHHSALADLAAEGARVRAEARVVDDGDIVTCGGVTAGLDLALWLVERFAGPDFAVRTAAYLEYERRGGRE